MREEALAKTLSEILRKHNSWICNFRSLTLRRETHYSELEWSGSGGGEDTTLAAFRAEWPDVEFELDVEGGCDSCGWGESCILTIHGTTLPWETAA